jgi:lysozyme
MWISITFNQRYTIMMQTSEKGLDLIRKYEGLQLVAYVCPAGKLTIGYGHTGPDVKAGQKIDEVRADELLIKDVQRFEGSVNELVRVPMTQGMFDALISFTFNLGAGSLKSSTLLKKLNADDVAGAADQFLRWNKANGKELAGLTARRQSERKLFLA